MGASLRRAMAAERLRAVPDEPSGADSPNQLTIEQLASESGMSVRNIRAHQARGLLSPPEVRQRVGYYGPDHVARLRLITELQTDGFNLKGIERLLADEEGASEAMLTFRRAITAPFEDEQPEMITAAELAERFGEQPDPAALERSIKLGLLIPVGESNFEVPSPRLFRIAEEVVERGVEMSAALDVVAVMQRSSRYVADAFTDLFLEEIWKPFEEEGRPQERWPEVLEAIERLRPIASQALVAVFQMTMTTHVEQAFGKELDRMSGEKRRQ
jgi:DNA-binding transcriptional MerR regulator